MSANLRRHLVEGAEILADRALGQEGAQKDAGDAAHFARAARDMLEAATMVEGAITPGAVEAALGKLGTELVAAGLEEEYIVAEGAEHFLRMAFTKMRQYRGRAHNAEAVGAGYAALRDLCEDLEATFRRSGTDTSRRVADRISARLERVDQELTQASHESAGMIAG